MDTQRLILFIVFSFSILMLWEAWQKETNPQRAPTAQTTPAGPTAGAAAGAGAVPGTPQGAAPAAAPVTPGASTGSVPAATTADAAAARTLVTVKTDVIDAQIDPMGGDLVLVRMHRYKNPTDDTKEMLLLDPSHRYAAQSGLTGSGLPNHRTLFKPAATEYALENGKDTVEVRLEAEGANGVRVVKTWVFKRGSYLVDLRQEIVNGGTAPVETFAYFHLTRDDKAPPGDQYMISTFTGPAVFTEASKYQKLSWSDIAKGKVPYPTGLQNNGWVAMVQHYFVAAWVPPGQTPREFYTERISDGFFRAGVKTAVPSVAPGATGTVSMPLYVGPQEQDVLRDLAPGLDLVVDYGFLHIIAAPLFWVLKFFHGLTGNWGWAIVLLTVLIKAIFFPLSAASYKSMAKMKQVTPRLMKLREQYGDDRMKLNQAMMDLYKTEKINPLGGCFPILIQIPVFISLYWVLLGAVELRQAPFIGWIHDLSIPDPFYVLPVLMLASMILQTKLNPTPPDPVQAKVMMVMPFVFGIMFFWFPAGLVLYWLVNNVLSIAQQWQITRMIESGAGSKGSSKPAK